MLFIQINYKRILQPPSHSVQKTLVVKTVTRNDRPVMVGCSCGVEGGKGVVGL